MGNRFGSILSLSLCVFALSACESVSHVWDGQTSTEVSMREDNGNVMAPLTPELRQANESSFIPSAPVGYQIQGAVNPVTAPVFVEPRDVLMANMNVSGDSSVTIFPLDGVVPNMSLGGPSASMPSSVEVNGSEFYDPSSYAPVLNYVAGGSPNAQIFFKHGSSRLGSGDMRKISSVAQGAAMAPGRISVEGHASRPAQSSDPVQSSILNLKESMNRAYAVSKTLIQKGVPANKLKTTAYGDTVPVGGEQQQRRVDIVSGGY